ncbi:MAG: UpxY family transcription antiterminator [Cyclobacteriaceae bacterium]|nr:UpxY family transcription antiterminator [Cyclobacteriaceae bacterium]
MLAEKEWHVFYTRSRWEKKVNSYLQENGFEVFLPLHKVMRQWTDRKKKVEVPLFNSYIFVRSNRNEIYEVLQIPGIVRNLKINGMPAILHDSEYIAIKNWLETGLPLETESYNNNFQLGERVKVIGGVFNGIEGEVRKINDKTCCIVLKSIQQVLKVNIRKELLVIE